MRKLVLAVLAAGTLLGSGCVFMQNSYVENAEFDLELPKPAAPARRIRLGVFKNLSCSDRRFLTRGAEGELSPSEYLRWRMAPELLLQRCMYGAFTVESEGEAAAPLLNAVIYRFEFDARSRTAHLGVDFTLRRSGGGRVVRADVSEPVAKWDSGAARAAAMNRCAARAVAELAGALK